MKKIIFGCILCSMMAMNAMAQDNNGAPRQRMDRKEMIERRVKDMTEKYGLTAEQAEKVKALSEKYMGQMGPRGGVRRDSTRQRPATDSNTGASAQQRPQRQPGQGGGRGMGRGSEGMKKYNEELQNILTPEQYKAYQEDMQKRMQRGGQRRGQQ